MTKGRQIHEKGGPGASWAPPGTLLGALGAPNGILVLKPQFVGRPLGPHGRPVWAHFRSKSQKKNVKKGAARKHLEKGPYPEGAQPSDLTTHTL